MPTRTPDLVFDAPPEKLRQLRDLQREVAELQRAKHRTTFPTPGALARHCEPATRQTPALDLIDRSVVALYDGTSPRQLLNAPPQTGKSQRISRWTPLWLLMRDPSLRIVIVSAEKELAVRWGRQIKRDLEAHPDLGLTLLADSKAAGRWETEQGGGLFCTGVAAGTTGRPIDVLLIDDPIKDRAQAESKTMRDRVWDFWENDAGQRARKSLIMSTRWHTADLHGQLLEKEAGRWSVLAIPAIAETDDPLGREPGEELQSANPELHPPGYYHDRQKLVSPYVWSSLFQQRPTAAEGGIFKRGDWRYWTAGERGKLLVDDHPFDLANLTRFITMDLAASTKTSADYTVACAWAITPFGQLILLDRVRQRVAATDHAALLEPLRSRWLTSAHTVWIESRVFGSDIVWQLGRKGLPVAELKADIDKFSRALPAADVVRQHRVFLPVDASWLDEWLDETSDFPLGRNDDQTDCLAYAVRVLETRWLGPEDDHTLNRRRALAAQQPDEIDFDTAVW